MNMVAIEDVEEYLGITSGTGGSVLASLVAEVSRNCAKFTGRTDWGGSSSRTEYHHGGNAWIAPRYWPITSVTSISDDPQHDWASSSDLDAGDYYVSTDDSGMIWLEGQHHTTNGQKSVKLVYTAGYTSTSAIPADLRLAAKVQVKHEWDIIRRPGRGESAEVGAGELLPQVMKTLVNHTRRVPFA